MKTVIAVPWRSDQGGRRDELWKFTRAWIEARHDWPIITADCDPGPFNRGQAINRAAAEAGDWDILIVHDADNIADPATLEEAVQAAWHEQRVIIPYEVYIYLDRYSSDQLLSGAPFMFHAPVNNGGRCCGRSDHHFNHSVLHDHHSGIQVLPRKAFDAVGGFIEFSGWGYEDSVMAHLLRTLAGGIKWLHGSALHLWHEHAYDQKLSATNYQHWQRLTGQRTPARLRQALDRYGHAIPPSRDGELPMTAALQKSADVNPAVLEALNFEAPYLVEKLLKERVIDSAEHGIVLFTELKRYLVLNQVDRTRAWKLQSMPVNEVWQHFVLFTVEYAAFCDRHFGHYVHYAPSNAPDPGFAHRAPEATFAEFGDRYREIFGLELPDVWDDAASITLHRRILNDRAGQLELDSTDNMANLIGRNGRVLFSANVNAQDALRFIVETGAFYVRELPGDLTDDEKIALISTMVDIKLLRIG